MDTRSTTKPAERAPQARLSRETYRDKLSGCWMGKNAGGTLGGPLESIFGQEEMFDVWWYPRLVKGGIPNDDLDRSITQSGITAWKM